MEKEQEGDTLKAQDTSQQKISINIEFSGFEPQKKEMELDATKTYSQMLLDLDINPETAVILKDGQPIPSDEPVEGGTVKIVRVISGG
ncbi:MAG: MoaD/ThiS family protein [Archaeoglobaceae archaeon]